VKSFRVYGLTCVLMLAAVAARATTIILPSDEQLIAKSTFIADATVLSSTPIDRNGTIWTETVLEVSHALKGELPQRVTVRGLGGILDDRITRIFGAPEFVAGERVLVFLEADPRGDYRVVDLMVGKFSEGLTGNGQRLWLREHLESEVHLLDAQLEPIATKNVQRQAVAFETFVRDRVAGRKGERNYGVENPVLAPKDDETRERGRFESNFTLISAPSVYRWFRFGSGQGAQWYSSGTQPGYANGGVGEIATAMKAWTGYSSANINYTYNGGRSGTSSGFGSPDGTNDVLLNDPFDDIAGSWNRSSGGVVGLGGFNGVSSRQTWTATFAADAAHPAGAQSAWNITEGNLTIQDGVSPSAGISSSRLAEIIAHEFGHTLGFGHSPEGNALMYASVTGIGPSLRADDQLAARWLYPNGSGAPPTPPPPPAVPGAPGNLRATVSGNNLDLAWDDYASNETGFAVYLASGSGSFSKRADLGANVRTARLSSLASGSYRAYVVAVNAAGSSSQSNTIGATIATSPVASFSMTPQTGTAGVTTFTFYDESTGGVVSRRWDFGDGGSSTNIVATRLYAASGQYTVTLTVTGAGGVQSSTSKSINVGGAIAPYRALVSVATYGGGVGGTSWRTELNLFNAGSQGASISLVFLPTAGGDVVSRSLYLAPRQLATYANALADLFDIPSGAGALGIEATSAGTTADLRVSSRTFTTGQLGTYGQAVPQVEAEDLEKTLYITGMATNASYRTNVGLVNRGGSAMSATLTLYARNGQALSTKTISIPANSFQQSPLAAYFPEVNGGSQDGLTMRIVAASNAAISGYASVVDNLSQDPIYMQARPAQSGGTLTIPVVGRSAGANNTFWRSDVTIYNPNAGTMNLTLRHAGVTKSLALGGNDTTVIADVLSQQFGLASGTGALQLSWSSAIGPVVTSRTYTTAAQGGTYGQSIDPVASFSRRTFVPGLRNDGSYRSNIGFVNGGAETETFSVVLLSPSGNELARSNMTLAAGQQTQTAVSSLFPNAPLQAGFTLQMEGDANAKLFGYGSMVDNVSGDPVFFAGQ